MHNAIEGPAVEDDSVEHNARGLPARRCAWCGAGFDEGSELRKGRRHCGACGAWTTDPWPSDEELDRAYGDWYRPGGGRFSGPGDALLRRLRARAAARIDELAPPGRVLDVGAGDGTLVDALRSRGREAVGLERHATRTDFIEGELDDVEGEWAAVVFWHSLEHLRAPAAALARAAERLAASGIVVAAIPNVESWQSRAFGDRWFALDLPRHLVHVPPRALIAGMHAAGLRAERVSHVRGGQAAFGWLHGFVGVLPGRPSLYDAIRRPPARSHSISRSGRAGALAAATVLSPIAAVCAAAEASARRGGSVYVEARRA